MIHFSFEIEEKNNAIIFYLKGSLLESEQASLMVAAAEDYISKGKYNFVLNLGEFVYMSSSGLSVFINLLTKARKKDGDAVICCINGKTDEVLTITKLNSVFKVYKDVDEAVNSYN